MGGACSNDAAAGLPGHHHGSDLSSPDSSPASPNNPLPLPNNNNGSAVSAVSGVDGKVVVKPKALAIPQPSNAAASAGAGTSGGTSAGLAPPISPISPSSHKHTIISNDSGRDGRPE